MEGEGGVSAGKLSRETGGEGRRPTAPAWLRTGGVCNAAQHVLCEAQVIGGWLVWQEGRQELGGGRVSSC